MLTGIALGLLLIHYLGWTLISSSPSLPRTLLWGVEGGAFLLGAVTCVWGIRPALTVRCDADALHLQQGNRSLRIAYTAIDFAGLIAARRFHRHEGRYAATHVFVGALGEEVILLRTPRGPVVIGLASDADQADLLAHLETTITVARTEDAVL